MKKSSSSTKELEEQVIVASYRARQVEEDMIVSKHRTGELEEQVGQLKEQMHKAGELEEQMVQLKEQMLSMQQDFNKKHDDLLSRLDSLSAKQQEMSIDVVMSDLYTVEKSKPYRLNVNSRDTVDALKLKIRETTGVPQHEQRRLMHGYQLLDIDCRTLSDYGIQSGSTINFDCLNPELTSHYYVD